MASTWVATGTSARGDRLLRMEASPNYRDGQFRNALPMVEPKIFKTIAEYVRGASNTTPKQPLPVLPRAATDFAGPPASGLRTTWLGHSTTLVEIDGSRLLLDPVWAPRSSPMSWAGPRRFFEPPLALEDLPELDAVLISHDHFDHLDMEAVRRLSDRGNAFIVPLGVGAHLEYWGVPGNKITELDWWDEAQVGSLTVTATPARHFSGRSLVMADRNSTLWTGFAIAGTVHRLYYSGDTGMFDGFPEIGHRLGPFDAALVEVGAYNHMWADFHLGPEQAVAAARQVGAGLLIPVHWGTFELALHAWTEPVERLIVAAQPKALPLAIPRPGESVDIAAPPSLVRWWPDLPWRTAEEDPIVSSGLAQTQ